jgi:heme oxygenase
MKFDNSQVFALAATMGILLENSQGFSTSRIMESTRRAKSPAWTVAFVRPEQNYARDIVSLGMTATDTATAGFIDTELRGAAMKLHTKEQAPKEGEVEVEKPKEPYTPTRDDYLAFLVDSKHVYEALEDIVNEKEELATFRNTGLERTKALETDIQFMVIEYGLNRPEVGDYGKAYASELREIAAKGNIPEFICHYYNFYFAHTAGGRMIGKQMSALLLDKKTLEFYKVSRFGELSFSY